MNKQQIIYIVAGVAAAIVIWRWLQKSPKGPAKIVGSNGTFVPAAAPIDGGLAAIPSVVPAPSTIVQGGAPNGL